MKALQSWGRREDMPTGLLAELTDRGNTELHPLEHVALQCDGTVGGLEGSLIG